MTKIGDIKQVKRFAFFPTKIENIYIFGFNVIWIHIFKEMKYREMQPVANVVTEDGYPVYDKRFSKYEWKTYTKFVRVKRSINKL